MAAGTRGGKSISAGAEFSRRIFIDEANGKGRKAAGAGKDRRARLHYWVVSPTVALLKEPKRYLMEMLSSDLFERPKAPINSEGQLWLKGDILIEFKSADNPLGLVSVGLDGLWIDEAARVKQEAWVGNLRGRLTDHHGWCLFSSTPLGRNWFYFEIIVRGLPGSSHDPEFESIVWTTADNPYIPAEEIEAARRQLPARYFSREYLANFDAFSGNVYEDFTEAVHVFDNHQDPRAFKRVIGAMDFGWNSPGCIEVVGDFGNGTFAVVDEVYRTNTIFYDPRLMKDTWVTEVKRLQQKWGIRQWFCDPAEPDKIFDLVRNGINAVGADNDIVYGIRQTATALHPVGEKPALRIWRGCSNLLREIPLYIWGASRTGKLMEFPADGQSDHALDPLRYAMVELLRYAEIGQENTTSQSSYMGYLSPRPIG